MLRWFLDDLQMGFDVDVLDGKSLPPPHEDKARILAAFNELGSNSMPEGLTVDDLMPMFSVFTQVINSTMAYRPLPVQVNVQLIRVRDQVVREYTQHPDSDSPDWGWHAFTAGLEVETSWIEGTHYTLLAGSSAHRVASVLCRPAETNQI